MTGETYTDVIINVPRNDKRIPLQIFPVMNRNSDNIQTLRKLHSGANWISKYVLYVPVTKHFNIASGRYLLVEIKYFDDIKAHIESRRFHSICLKQRRR